MKTTNPKPLLRILIVEDQVHDAELVVCALEQAGFDFSWSRVDTETDYLTLLDTAPDIILSDYSVPHFGGMRALALLHKHRLDIPFVLVSSTIGDEHAVEVMRAGADDYVPKDRLGRLGAAVSNALQKKRLRFEKFLADRELRETRAQLEAFLEFIPYPMFIKGTDGRYLRANRRFNEAFGLTKSQIIGKRDAEIFAPLQAKQFRNNDHVVIQSGRPVEYEETAQFQDGSHVSIVSKFPILDSAGGVYAVGGIATEITERKIREAHLHATFEQDAIGIIHTTPDGHFLRANGKFCRMVGYAEEELRTMTFIELTHPDDVTTSNGLRKQFLDNTNLVSLPEIEKRYLKRDGSALWVTIAVSVVRKANLEADYFVTMVQDVSARKAAEERFRTTFEQAAVGIVRATLDREIIDMNRKFCEMTGYDRNELMGMTLKQISHPDDRGQDTDCRNRLIAGEIEHFQSEKRYVRKNSEIFWVRRTTSLARDPVDNSLNYVVVVEDVSERKGTEEKYRAMFENAPIGIMHSTTDRSILHVNPKLCEILGYTHEELLTMNTADLLPYEYRESDRPSYIEDLLKGEIKAHSSERPFLHKNGSVVWTHRTVSLVRNATGQPLYFLRIIEDITNRKRTEQLVRESEQRFRAIFDHAGVGITIRSARDRNLSWTHFNECFSNMLGYTREELQSLSSATITHPDDQDRAIADNRRLLREECVHYSREKRILCKNGRVIWVVLSVATLPDDQGRPDNIIAVYQDITARKQAEINLAGAQTRLEMAVQSANVGLWDWNLETNHVFYSREWKAQLGYSADEIGDTLKEWERLTHADDVPSTYAKIEQYLANPWPNFEIEFRMRHKDGSWRWILSRATVQHGDDTKRGHMIGGHIDITERKRVEAALQESDEKFRQLVFNIPQVFWITDAEQKTVIYVSPAYETVTGRSLKDLQANPRDWLNSVHEDDRERVRRARKVNAIHGDYDVEYRVVHIDGTVRWIHDRAFPVKDHAGKPYRITGISEDITESRQTKERLLHLAHYDVLTSLPNRVLFYDRLKQALAQAQRNDWFVGVLFIDLDRFKDVNDTLGHAIGDILLQQVSNRIAGCVRLGDTVGRLGGDEFAVVLSELAAPQDASLVAQKIHAAFAEPFMLEGNEIYSTASIGITLYPSDSKNIDVLIRNADAAMFSAKNQGRNTYQFFTAEMNERAQEKMKLEINLRRALERREFVLHYQPKVDIVGGTISGFEALLRWQTHEGGLISPAQFIPVLEETGLIVQVGEWVLKEVCTQIQAWQQAGVDPKPVAVNLSARQLHQPGFDVMLRETLEQFGIGPQWIEVEITESAVMTNPEAARTVLANLKNYGIRLSIDDFGTGYSSLAYLKRFPIDALKIDQSFVRDLVVDPEDAAITRSVITLAHSLNLKVVAEGVETCEQLAYLSANGCDQAQGYLFSRPLPGTQCTELLRSKLPLAQPVLANFELERPAVLLLDDNSSDLQLMEYLINEGGRRILTANNANTALDLLSRHKIDTIVADQNMPDISGVEFLKRVKRMYPLVRRIMRSGMEDHETMISAINEGEVHRFFVKGRDDEMLRREIKSVH